MELDAEHGIAPDDRGEGPAVLGLPQRRGGTDAARVEAVDVVEVRLGRGAGEHRMRPPPLGQLHARPAHVRHRQRRAEPYDGALEEPEAGDVGRLLAPLQEELQAEADAERRLAARAPSTTASPNPVSVKARLAAAKCPTPGT